MKVYLIELEKGPRWVFHGERAAEAVEESGNSTSWGRRIAAWFGAAQDRLRKAEGRMGRVTRAVEGFLSRLESPEEPLLRRLRTVEDLTLVHGARLGREEALGKWRGHLQRQAWSHAGWLFLCVAAMPVCLITTFLPGPNVVGYWFLYRGLCHAMALAGISRAMRMWRDGATEREAALDSALDPRDDEAVSRLGEALGINGLRAYLERLPIRARVRSSASAGRGEAEQQGE